MKKIIVIILSVTIIFGIGCAPVQAKTTTNRDIVKEYCKKHYPNYKIKYYNYDDYNEKVILHRKGKKVVYVEKFVSYSSGKKYKSGYSEEGYYICYNKKVPKGKKVVSYLIYNPRTNYCDDIVAVVDNNKIR